MRIALILVVILAGLSCGAPDVCATVKCSPGRVCNAKGLCEAVDGGV